MTGYLRLSIFLFILSLFFSVARSQPAADAATLSDTATTRLAAWNAIDMYHRYMGDGSRLLNGPEHVGFLPFTSGHPYFLADTLQTGSVSYEGIWYRDVALIYDIVRDELVTPSRVGNMIVLSSLKVDEFIMADHHFIKREGLYYDLLCSGKMDLEVKRSKKILESIEQLQVQRNIQYTDQYFVVLNGERHSISNLRSLLALIRDKKKEVNQDLRRKKIRYRKDHERALIEAVTFYNQTFSR